MKNRIRHLIERAPLPAAGALWAAAAGIVIAFVLHWKGMILWDLGIFLLCCIDYGLSFRGKEIEAKRRSPRHLLRKAAQEIEIVLSNWADFPKNIKVRDQTPSGWEAAPVLASMVPARSEVVLRYPVTPPERGVYGFGDLDARVEGPLRLIQRPLRVPAAEEIRVLPCLQTLRYADLIAYRRRARHWGLRQIKWREKGRDFESLREYMEGDDPRHIHWKASARLDRPIVQEFQPEKNQIVMIAVDAGRLMGAVSEGKKKLDHALEASAQLAHAALAGGDQVGFLAFSDKILLFIPPKKTHGQLQVILEGTVSIHSTMVEPRYEEAFLWFRSQVRRRSLVVIFTDLMDELASDNLLDAVALLRPRHLPLCMAIRDSEWDDLMSRPPTNATDVYERSVLQETIRQRRKAIGKLQRKGAIAMDLPPSRLSSNAMEHYLDVKRRGLL
ncbi:MAG: DUF58 domain-containing protein [Deltaproteobacteria bacterium]|jgi:uncharacterized protein (DUF58 family)|nr:DUF58 domain-containing protein [Deltaproteobacteria bacterium]